MKSFIEYITESDTSGAFEMEAALVAAANNDKKFIPAAATIQVLARSRFPIELASSV